MANPFWVTYKRKYSLIGAKIMYSEPRVKHIKKYWSLFFQLLTLLKKLSKTRRCLMELTAHRPWHKSSARKCDEQTAKQGESRPAFLFHTLNDPCRRGVVSSLQKVNREVSWNLVLDSRGSIHSQEMIKMKWLRSRNPGFLVAFFLYSWTIRGWLKQSVICFKP